MVTTNRIGEMMISVISEMQMSSTRLMKCLYMLYCVKPKALIFGVYTYALYHLPSIHHFLPQHRAENHLNILHKRIVMIVVAVQSHLVWVYHVVVVPHCQFLVAHPVNLLLRQPIRIIRAIRVRDSPSCVVRAFRVRLHPHRLELMAVEQLPVLPHTFLHEQHCPTRHLHLNQYGHHLQHRSQNQQSQQRDHPVKYPFQYHNREPLIINPELELFHFSIIIVRYFLT